jgi:hypothetical protein
MIRIEYNTNQNIFISLTDKRLTTSDTYIFKFINQVTSEEVILTLNDISLYKNRYSKFVIQSTSFLNKTKGFWNYYVTQIGSGNNIIATGKMLLEADNLSIEGVARYEGYNGNYKTYTI